MADQFRVTNLKINWITPNPHTGFRVVKPGLSFYRTPAGAAQYLSVDQRTTLVDPFTIFRASDSGIPLVLIFVFESIARFTPPESTTKNILNPTLCPKIYC